MLITLEGSSLDDFASNNGRRDLVSRKTLFTFKFKT